MKSLRGKAVLSLLLVLTTVISILLIPGCSLFQTEKSGVIIYEVYTAGGCTSGENYSPYSNCYAVLYNSREYDVDINGWVLKYCENNTEQVVENSTVKLSGIISPKCFYTVLLGESADAADPPKGEDLPFEVKSKGLGLRMNKKAGILALCSSSGANATILNPSKGFVEDYFSYCDNDFFTKLYEGTAAATGGSVKKIYRRVGFTDTNENSTDFETKDIIDKPTNIIRYTSKLTSDKIGESTQHGATVKLSHDSGYYSKTFSLAVTTDLKDGSKIYYTTDGSAPVTPLGTVSESAVLYDESKKIKIYDRTGDTAKLAMSGDVQEDKFEGKAVQWPPQRYSYESDSQYNERLKKLGKEIFKINIIRVAAVNDKGVVTATKTGSFIVSSESLQSRFNLPIVSVISDSEGLIGKETGIFKTGNLNERSVDFERPAIIQYFEKNGELKFTQNFGLRLNGGYSRSFPQKSLRINMSDKKFSFDLFGGAAKNSEGKNITYFDRFVLRAGGNDWQFTGARDYFWQKYCSTLGSFETQAQRPCIAFINGELWGIYYMTERIDNFYIESHYGVKRGDVAIAEGFKGNKEGPQAVTDELWSLHEFIAGNDMSNEDNYKKFTDAIDTDSYIDYFICELYCGNTDWPNYNLRLWKNGNSEEVTHQKWRLIMTDVDFAFASSSGYDHDTIDWLLKQNDKPNAMMFKSLLKNKNFKSRFISRFEELLDEFFVYDKMVKTLDGIKNQLSTATPEHRKRWQLGSDDWNGSFDYIKEYLNKRNYYMRKALDKLK